MSERDIPLPHVIESDYDFDTTLERLRLKRERYLQTMVDVTVKQRDYHYASFEFRVRGPGNDVSVFGTIQANESGEIVRILLPDFLTIAPVRSSMIFLVVVFVFLVGLSGYRGDFSLEGFVFVSIIWLSFLGMTSLNFFAARKRFFKVLDLIEETLSVLPKNKRS